MKEQVMRLIGAYREEQTAVELLREHGVRIYCQESFIVTEGLELLAEVFDAEISFEKWEDSDYSGEFWFEHNGVIFTQLVKIDKEQLEVDNERAD